MRNKTQVDFQVCPMAGHNTHRAVERCIGIILESLQVINLDKQSAHATELQTLLKVVESS
jgi:hypothetical protein